MCVFNCNLRFPTLGQIILESSGSTLTYPTPPKPNRATRRTDLKFKNLSPIILIISSFPTKSSSFLNGIIIKVLVCLNPWHQKSGISIIETIQIISHTIIILLDSWWGILSHLFDNCTDNLEIGIFISRELVEPRTISEQIHHAVSLQYCWTLLNHLFSFVSGIGN